MQNRGGKIRRWLARTPVQTFIIIPLVVIAFELAWRSGKPAFVPWGCPLLAWGYLQYLLVGRYRLPRAGGSWGIEILPDRIVATGPYRYTRNPMYLGHLIFMLGIAITFSSWFALVLLIARAAWFHGRVLKDETRLAARFGDEYVAYARQVRRWIPGIV